MRSRSSCLTICLGATVIVVLAMMCSACSSGGGDTDTTAPAVASAGGSSIGTTTTRSIDGLSSFKSKDPFELQALATTTSSTPTTVATTVPTTTPTTVPSTTSTTVVHSLQLVGLPGDGTLDIILDGLNLSNLTEGAVLNGDWGSIVVFLVEPTQVTFRRDGSVDYVLIVDAFATW